MHPFLRFLAVLTLVFGAATAHAQTTPAQATPAHPGAVEMAMGPADAKVTVIEYASFTCPHCATFHATILPRFKQEYVDTGKVRFIYRDFPLDGAALRASQLARCRGPDSFFGMTELLFQQQRTWANREWQENLARLARLGGIGREQFDACMADKALETFVLQSRQTAEREFRITGTPAIIVNGRNIGAPASFEDLKKAVDPLIAG